jgi:hypothetical protein
VFKCQTLMKEISCGSFKIFHDSDGNTLFVPSITFRIVEFLTKLLDKLKAVELQSFPISFMLAIYLLHCGNKNFISPYQTFLLPLF